VLVLLQPSANAIVLAVIEKGLDSLGDSPKQAIWTFLENEYNLDKNELPQNIRAFQEALQKIFGLGYSFLDALFCHYFAQATGKQFSENQSFVECVESQFYNKSK
jgi:hypothetical protein